MFQRAIILQIDFQTAVASLGTPPVSVRFAGACRGVWWVSERNRAGEGMDSVVVFVEGVTVESGLVGDDDVITLELGVSSVFVPERDSDKVPSRTTSCESGDDTSVATPALDGASRSPSSSPDPQALSRSNSCESHGSWTEHTPVAKVLWKRTATRRLATTPTSAGFQSDPGSAVSTPVQANSSPSRLDAVGLDGVASNRQVQRSASDEAGATRQARKSAPISPNACKSIVWREHVRLRFQLPATTPRTAGVVAKNAVPSQPLHDHNGHGLRVMVDVRMLANGKEVAVGSANVAVHPFPEQRVEVPFHRLETRGGPKHRVVGARVAIAQLRSVPESSLPYVVPSPCANSLETVDTTQHCLAMYCLPELCDNVNACMQSLVIEVYGSWHSCRFFLMMHRLCLRVRCHGLW